MIPWLDPALDPHFPHTSTALVEPPGLLAAGGDLGIDWLLLAYRNGIFPWFSEGEPILWWSPAPRTVLFPADFHTSKSLRKHSRQGRYRITENQRFGEVIRACAAERDNQQGTWINPQMIAAYESMHRAGHAHSIEYFEGDELLGGLYGIAIGKVFFGESMYSQRANASKLCLKHLAECGRYELIDCQMATAHLQSLGAIEMTRAQFEEALQSLAIPDQSPGNS